VLQAEYQAGQQYIADWDSTKDWYWKKIKRLDKALDKAISYICELKSNDCKYDRCYGCPLENKCDNARCVRADWKEWCDEI